MLLNPEVCVSAASCSSGYSRAPDSDLKMCAGDVYSCLDDVRCCEPDRRKCAGQTIQCSIDMYLDPEKAGSSIGQAADQTAMCCTHRAKCGSQGYTCPDGYRKRVSIDNMLCATDVASCGGEDSPCCEPDLDVDACGSNLLASPYVSNAGCGRSRYRDPAKAASIIDWESNAGMGDLVSKCCSQTAMCSSTAYSCPEGFVKKQHMESELCPSDAGSCSESCCEADPTTCRAQADNCSWDHYRDPNKAGNKVGTDMLRNCCSEVAICRDAFGIQAAFEELSPIAPNEGGLPKAPGEGHWPSYLLHGALASLLLMSLVVIFRQRKHLINIEKELKRVGQPASPNSGLSNGQVLGVPVATPTEEAVNGSVIQDKSQV